MKLNAFILLLFTASASFAQTFQIKGRVKDSSDTTGIIGASISVTTPKDTTKRYGAFTDIEGNFSVPNLPNGLYTVRISYIGYTSQEKVVTIADQDHVFEDILLKNDAKQLKEVIVQTKAIRVEQKGDTTQYNAESFKVNQDASAEDLIKKMPGVLVVDGKVQAQGEDIKRVTVDGREFFGDDAAAALKNLPAEIIDKVQVFDRLSDQAQFSGFNDGNTEKTVNIVTKSGKNNGQFGKLYGGYGSDDRYSAGGNVNYFKKDTRLSIIGLSNNVNQQNFSSDDLLGVLGTNNNRGGGNFGGGGGGGRPGGGGGGFGGGGGGSDPSSFLVSGQGGITRTNALGINLTDNWGKKIKFNGSYFFNGTNNQRSQQTQRTIFTSAEDQLYEEDYNRESNNFNHRISSRIEYTVNKTNSFIFTPQISVQQNKNTTNSAAQNSLPDLSTMLSNLLSTQTSKGTGVNAGGDLLFRHRFAKAGRTFSLGVGNSYSYRWNDGTLYSKNEYFSLTDTSEIIDQISNTISNSNTFRVRGDYNEPLSKNSQLQFSYNGSFQRSDSDKRTYDNDLEGGGYIDLNNKLTNIFDNSFNTNRGQISYRYNKGQDFNMNFGVSYQHAQLTGEQLFPSAFTLRKTFANILPNAFIRYNINKNQNFRIFYRTSTNAPSINQLQSVLNNSNPLQLSIGNPDLKQEYSNAGSIRYSSVNPQKATSFMVNVFGETRSGYISNASYVASQDTTINNIFLKRGTQLNQPVNVGTSYSIRSFMNYGFPLKIIKSNLNFNAGINYTETPGLVNNKSNTSENTTLSGGLVIGSNISEQIDFTVSYNGNYSIINNTVNPSLNSNYYYQNISAKVNLLSKKGFLFNTEAINTIYTGLGEGYNQNFTLLNASVGQKFLKNNAGELKLTAFDLLNQNNSISRSITESYVEDVRSMVLNRYFLMTFTYTIRNFR